MNKKQHEKSARFKRPTKIVAFDCNLKLVAVFGSYNMAEKITGIPHQRLLKACKGDAVAIGKHYWRELEETEDEAMFVEPEDFGSLSLIDFDNEIGVEREVYYNRKMKRGEIIPESEYKNKVQYIKSFKYQQWKRERLKQKKDE